MRGDGWRDLGVRDGGGEVERCRGEGWCVERCRNEGLCVTYLHNTLKNNPTIT